VCADGSVRRLEWNTAVREGGAVYCVARDTTRRRRIEAELVEVQRLLEASRNDLRDFAAEQAALRRVAELVTRGSSADALFAAVARETGEVLGVDATHLGRFDAQDTVVSVGQWGPHATVPLGARFPLAGDSVSARVLRTGQPARMHGYDNATGHIAQTVRGIGIRYAIGVPISVAGQLWGVMVASSTRPIPFPVETETRLQGFTELVATAVVTASAHAGVRALADEQAALRRVATMVAEGGSAEALFQAVVGEIGTLLDVDAVNLGVNHEGRTMSPLAKWPVEPGQAPVPDPMPIVPGYTSWEIVRTGAPARQDDWSAVEGTTATWLREHAGIRSTVGAPIKVEGELWGVIVVHSKVAVLPPDTEARLERFAALVGTALTNAQARSEVRRLADQQAALRRVATLVAEGANPSAVFDAVTREVAELLSASSVSLARYEDDVLLVVAQHGAPYVHVGDTYPLGGNNVSSTVLRTGRTARLDEFEHATGRIGEVARDAAVRSVVAAPIVVEGRTWGVLAAVWSGSEPPPGDTEERLTGFAELLDTAIANADSRDQLAASRARVLAAGDEARRRVVRDLHDGAQQRQVSTILALKLAQHAQREDRGDVDDLLAEALSMAERAMAELRELAHGILPGVLTHGGLRAGVQALVSRLALPVDLDVPGERISPDIEASAYFIVAEALTNVVKHAQATRATVTAAIEEGAMTLEVRDDGVGGADPEGHGLVGIADRVDALGGQLEIDSTAGRGTVLTARLPLGR
jgi:signal transduction histidine kinase